MQKIPIEHATRSEQTIRIAYAVLLHDWRRSNGLKTNTTALNYIRQCANEYDRIGLHIIANAIRQLTPAPGWTVRAMRDEHIRIAREYKHARRIDKQS